MKQPITVVVVDDSEDILEMLEMALDAAGYAVFGAADALRAFELVRRERPQVLLTDIMLGVTSGLELITRVRSDLTPPLPTIIAMSGFGDVADEALRRGACLFLPKPFVVEDLLDAIASALSGHKPSEHAIRRVADDARRQRAEATAAVDQALVRLAPRSADLHRRAEWTVRWLPRYLGFGHAFVALVRENRIRADAWSPGAPIDPDAPLGESLPLLRDIAETASSIVLSGSGTPVLGHSKGFFAGVPLRVGDLAIGAFCVFDEHPHSLDSADFEVMQAFGRRASSLLADDPNLPPPLWTQTGVLSRAAFDLLLSALLRRCQRGRDALNVGVFACNRPPSEWQEPLLELIGAKHSVVAEVGVRRYGVVTARPDDAYERASAARKLAVWADRANARLGLVTVENAVVSGVGELEVLRLGELALSRALARRDEGEGRIERFAIGRAAPSADEGALSEEARPYEARNGPEP